MSTPMQETPLAPATADNTFREERDALLPRNGYVIIATADGDGQEYLKIPRLNMRRTLRLSQWLDSVISRDNVQQTLNELMSSMSGADVEESAGLSYMLTINKFISTLTIDEALELFAIITNQSHEWLDERWELGWGVQAIRVAFQQQGFANLFTNAANQTGGENNPTQGATQEAPQQNAESVPQSISSSPHMGGQTMTYSNSPQSD